MESRWFETVKILNWMMKKKYSHNYEPISVEEILGTEDDFFYY